jgi:hypothetical protein
VELVELAKRAALKRAGKLSLSPRLLRTEHTRRAARAPVGLAEVLISLAANPEHGGVRISKPELGVEMADFLVAAWRASTDRDELRRTRPAIDLLLKILGVL